MTTSFHVSISGDMKTFVQKRIKEKKYRSRGSYVQDLIRQDQLRAEKVKLTNMLLVGLASGQGEMTEEKWDKFKKETVCKISKK